MQMSRLLLVVSVLLLVARVEYVNALKCYWCVGIHCKHEGSGEEIDCNGSCYDMRGTLSNGLHTSLLSHPLYELEGPRETAYLRHAGLEVRRYTPVWYTGTSLFGLKSYRHFFLADCDTGMPCTKFGQLIVRKIIKIVASSCFS